MAAIKIVRHAAQLSTGQGIAEQLGIAERRPKRDVLFHTMIPASSCAITMGKRWLTSILKKRVGEDQRPSC